MSIFTRRFTFDPGNEVLLNIESVNILDLEPPSAIIGLGTGAVLVVGEFENGPFGQTTEVFSPNDMVQTFGSLGYQYSGLIGQNPCARQRSADGDLTPEPWNGNGIVQLNAKSFARLLVCRVDTSVGQVVVGRLAFLTGATSFRYQLLTGQVLQLDLGAGPASATFTAAVATVTAVGGTYPTTFTGGNTLTLGYDGVPNFVVTFLAADQSAAQVVARINQYAGFAFADLSGGQVRLTGLQGGTGGQVRVVSGSAGVLVQLGLTAATSVGTGNVANINAVTPAEVTTVVQAAIASSKVELDQNGALRISNTSAAPFILVGAGTTATGLGFVAGTQGTTLGQPVLVSGTGTYATGFTGVETLTLQLGGRLAPVVVAFAAGDQSLAQVVARFNTAFTAAGQGTPAAADGGTRFTLTGPTPSDTVSVLASSAGSVLTTLGLVLGQTVGQAVPQGLLPAGTLVQSTTGTLFVTMQDCDFEVAGVTVGGVLQSAGAATFSVKVRHALDDGSGTGVGAGTVTTVVVAPLIGAFSVTNPQVINNALTEAQIDAQYVLAIQATANLNDVSRQANIQFSARQSNAVRNALRNIAIFASSNGCRGRMAIVRPPLGTTKLVATSVTAQPGVGAYRDRRTIYAYPQANTFVPIIARVGVSGGSGFNASGNVDVGADGFLASVMSQLPPEENIGQLTEFTPGVNGLESSPNAQNFQMTDYIAFKAAGICAIRMDEGVAIFQSEATSVDPTLNPSLVTIKRQRMADFITDSIATAMKEFGKKLGTVRRRRAIASEIRVFLNGLAGGGPSPGNPNSPDNQRIDTFSLDPNTGNTATTLGQGLFRLIIKVRLLSSLDSIVLQTTIGEQVTVDQLPQAA